MTAGSATGVTTRRGSSSGPDGLYYPCEEKPRVPISAAALQLMSYLIAALRHLLYSVHELVYVSGDQFIYYVPHDPTRSVAPDVYVRFGVPKEPERQVFRTWEEGGAPSFVAEISSKDSRTEDRGPKFTLYQDVLRCREYLIYDEERNELLLYRREEGAFQPVPQDENGRVYSEELNLWFGREPGILVRVYGPDGQPVLDTEELHEHAEVEARRADALAEEVERLRAELARALQERGA